MQLELTFISKEEVGSGATTIQGLVQPAYANWTDANVEIKQHK